MEDKKEEKVALYDLEFIKNYKVDDHFHLGDKKNDDINENNTSYNNDENEKNKNNIDNNEKNEKKNNNNINSNNFNNDENNFKLPLYEDINLNDVSEQENTDKSEFNNDNKDDKNNNNNINETEKKSELKNNRDNEINTNLTNQLDNSDDKNSNILTLTNNDNEEEKKQEEEPERETWDKKADFLLSIIGFAVDLANVWRFPYLCYKNGGGAFLIPYFTMLIFGAAPLFYLELLIGQIHRKGPIAVWDLAPIFRGVGICQCLISFFVAFYYNVILAWSLYYFYSSFTSSLPWASCINYWNTINCHENSTISYQKELILNYNLNFSSYNYYDSIIYSKKSTPSEEFFERRLLELHESEGLEDLGGLRMELVFCLILVFTIIYFSLFKGIKTSGKVMWVTVISPYIILFILFVRGLFLPGSLQGIYFYIFPSLSKLTNPSTWIDAAVQIFFSVGAGFGVHLSFASYNKSNHNCYKDFWITTIVNSATSLFSGFVIFSYLGFMAYNLQIDVSEVASSGPGLVFIVYPTAIATLPASSFWAIIFFLMLITLGIDSAMGGLESILTGLMDLVPKEKLKKHKSRIRKFLTFLVVFTAFFFALPNVTKGGVYLITIWDNFASGSAILIGVLVEVLAISWFYGLRQLKEDIQKNLNFSIGIFWTVCWKFISPILILIIIIYSFKNNFDFVYYHSTLSSFYYYPTWSKFLAWGITFSSVIFIPLTAIYQIFKSKGGLKQKLALAISPIWEHEDIINKEEVERFKIRHWLC